jgi:hypothetical protein
VLAHHDLHQLQRDPDVASAVLSNAGTRVVFCVGDADAHVLEKGFSAFTAKDLQNLGTGEAICRIERSDADFNLSIPLAVEEDIAQSARTREQVATASRSEYATRRADMASAPVLLFLFCAHPSSTR